MNLVKYVSVVFSIYLCYCQELETVKNETEEIRQRREPAVSCNQIKKNESVKVILNVNNGLPKTQLNPKTKPITNLRGIRRPIGVVNNRINALHRGTNFMHPIKRVTVMPPACPKVNERNETADCNITKYNYIIEKPIRQEKKVTFCEDEEENKNNTKYETTKPPENKTDDECYESKSDKSDIIISLIKQLPDLITASIKKNIKSEGNQIVIKNITEINLPIQGEKKNKNSCPKSETKENRSNIEKQNKEEVCDDTVKAAKFKFLPVYKDTQFCDTNNNDNKRKNLVNYLLKPIKRVNPNCPQVPAKLSNISWGNNKKEKVKEDSIEFKQSSYSETVVPPESEANETKETEQATIEPMYCTTMFNPSWNNLPYFNQYVHDCNPIHSVPHNSVPATNSYNTDTTHSKGLYSHYYPPSAYASSPYEYYLPQNVYTNNEICKPKYTKAKLELQHSDNISNRLWKTWCNTEITLKSKNAYSGKQN